eukprot:TRINITY_DN68360_c0_g1_i1.p1 TRINITY_DN68360_c0_g1~~TRINITY_DN68360_c0_g1_i1.p1  ORF type:complete len:830 (+),score=454.84 TRINITY_DN68360_c0_g1_i1:310-2490(+)
MDLLTQSDCYIKIRFGEDRGDDDDGVVGKDKDKKKQQQEPQAAVTNNETGRRVWRTSVCANSSRPVWNEQYKFLLPSMPKGFTLSAYDHDVGSKDDLIGTAWVELDEKSYGDDAKSPYKWVDLKSKDKKGNEVSNGMVQIRVRAGDNDPKARPELIYYDYTHLLQVNVDEGIDLKSSDVVGHNDNFIELSWGQKSFRTQVLKGANPKWGEKGFFWVDLNSQRDYQLQFRVMDKDEGMQDDNVGNGYIPASALLAAEGKEIEKVVILTKHKANTDRDLKSIDSHQARAHADSILTDGKASCGRVRVHLKLTKKEDVQRDFFRRLLKEYDISEDGRLQKVEVWAMLSALGVAGDYPIDRFDMFWAAADRDNSGYIDEQEALLFMRSLEFQSSDIANRLFTTLTFGSPSKALMAGMVRADMVDEIQIFDRQTGLMVPEYIPRYIKVAMKSMFGGKAGRVVAGTKRVKQLMRRLTVRQGQKYNDPKSVADIPAFIRLHHLNMDEVELPLDEYKTFNEFFYRKLKPGARPVAEPDDNKVLVSPADCRLVVFEQISDATDVWIKGDRFTIEALLGPRADELADRYNTGSMAICRLAPQDYHRWHAPVRATLGRRTPIDGELYTVNPLAINKNVNVFTQNKRELCEFESEEFGKVILVAVGATMVASINITAEDGSVVERGDLHGYFAFGGSTIILLFEQNTVQFDKDLVSRSKQRLETLVTANSRIGICIRD